MENKAKRKRSVKSSKQDDTCLSSKVSSPAEVAETATEHVIKEEICAEVAATSDRNRERKQSVTRRKRTSRSSSAADSAPAQTQVDSELVHDAQPPQKRKRSAVTSLQNDEPLHQEKRTRQSVDKKQLKAKKQHSTRTRKSTSGVQRAEKDQLEAAAVSDGKKRTKVKREIELQAASFAISIVDKTTVKIEKPSQHSCRKFLGAHVSIAGVFATCCQLYSVLYIFPLV